MEFLDGLGDLGDEINRAFLVPVVSTAPTL